jgi:hypothetical protein
MNVCRHIVVSLGDLLTILVLRSTLTISLTTNVFVPKLRSQMKTRIAGAYPHNNVEFGVGPHNVKRSHVKEW